MNPNRAVLIEKVVVHMGVGESGEKLVNGENLMSAITGGTPIRSYAKQTVPGFGIRKGAPIGCRVTLRGEVAEKFLDTSLEIIERKLSAYQFDAEGNFSFGVEEHTDYPGMTYDPKIGIFGFDVNVTVRRNGKRIARRHIQKKKLPQKQRVAPEDAIRFVAELYRVEVS